MWLFSVRAAGSERARVWAVEKRTSSFRQQKGSFLSITPQCFHNKYAPLIVFPRTNVEVVYDFDIVGVIEPLKVLKQNPQRSRKLRATVARMPKHLSSWPLWTTNVTFIHRTGEFWQQMTPLCWMSCMFFQNVTQSRNSNVAQWCSQYLVRGGRTGKTATQGDSGKKKSPVIF